MAKRKPKGEANAVTPEQAAEATARGEVVEMIAVEPREPFEAPAVPTIEDRVKVLEALLTESDKLIRQQARAIAIGVENADRLRKSRDRVNRLEAKMIDAKKLASEAKKSYEAAVSEHFELEKELDSPQQKLPFPAEPEEVPDPAPAQPADPEEWRQVPLDTLDLPKPVVSSLYSANLCTVGDLSDYLKPGPTGYCKRLTDLDGIGEAKAEQIEEALSAHWLRWAADQAQSLEAGTLAAVREAEAIAGAEFPDDDGDGDLIAEMIEVEFEDDAEEDL